MNIERDSLLQLKEDRKIYIRKLSKYGMAAPHIAVLKTLQKIYSMEPPSVAEIESICNDVKPLIQISTEYEEEQTPLQSTQNTYSQCYDYYNNLFYDSSLNEVNMIPERKRMIDSGISFHHPGVEEVEDIFITLTLHVDGKPATLFSGFSNDYYVFSFRILNANSRDLNTLALTQQALVIPKPFNKKGSPVEKDNRNDDDNGEESTERPQWSKRVEHIVDALLLDATVTGLCGVYLKVKDKWKHLRWAILTISGDSVAEEEILGMVNKRFSKFPCIFGQWCKQDKFCMETMTYQDLSAVPSRGKQWHCSSHALRMFEPRSAAAHIGALAGIYNLNEKSIEDYLKDEFSFLDKDFKVDAQEILELLKFFCPAGTFLWTPYSSFDPAYRQLMNTVQMSLQKRYELKRKMEKDFTFCFSADTEWNDGDIPSLPPTNLSDYSIKASKKSILRVTRMKNRDIFRLNHPLMLKQPFRKPYIQFSVGFPDPFLNLRQYMMLYNSLLVAPWGAIADDGMHHGANTISWICKVLKGFYNNCDSTAEMVSVLQEMYHIDPTDSLAEIPPSVIKLKNERLTKLDATLQEQLSRLVDSDSSTSTSTKIHDNLVNAFGYLPFLYQDSRLTDLVVFCCIEVVNIFSALLCCRQLSSCLWRMRTVISLLLSIIEGKLCPSAPTPTIHRLLHVPELVLITGPLVFTNNFFLEHSYSVTGKNLYASKNPALTCMLNMWTVTGGQLLLGPNHFISFYAAVTNGIDKIERVMSGDIVNGFESITRANAYDDSGLFYDESRFRKTYFDIEDHNRETASDYVKAVTNNWNATFEFPTEVSFYRVCRWREGHFLFASPIPDTVNYEFLKANKDCIVYSVDCYEHIQLLLVCGYGFCLLNSIPYVQAVCLPLHITNDHLFGQGSKDFRLESFSVNNPKWRLVSLYRLHFGEVRIEDGDNGNSYVIIRSLFCSQCTSMKNAWEFLPEEEREELLDPRELTVGGSGLVNGVYSTKELDKRVVNNDKQPFTNKNISSLVAKTLDHWKSDHKTPDDNASKRYDLRSASPSTSSDYKV